MSMMRTSLAGLALVAAVALSACGGGGGQTTQASNLSAPTRATGAQSSTAGATGTATATTSATGTQTATTSQTGTATANSGGASADASGAQCKAAGLTLSYLGGQGATGHGELGFALKNTGAACRTGGYPGIQFLSQSGAALPTTPQHTTDDFFGHLPLQRIALQPGQTASFRLGVSHGGGSSTPCHTAYGLQAIAPNDTATLRVQIPNGASECGQTTVSPLQPGTSAFQ
jgi:hypothetical protein